ncbi:DUF5777 family beta-barrel protein [Mucilaginibacter sp. AW1-3]
MNKYALIFALLLAATGVSAQNTDSLMNSLNAGDKKNEPVIAAFKATRLIFSQTTETVKKNNLNFLVIHRFGNIGTADGGAQTDFGLDRVNDVYIGFEYGLTDNFNIDLGRSTIGQLIDLQVKYAVLHQETNGGSPLAITLLGGAGVHPYGYGLYNTFGDRMSYIAEAIFSRKFTPGLSIVVAPIYVKDNTPLPLITGIEKEFVALSAAGRLKVTKHMSILVDYEHPFSDYRNTDHGFYDPLGFGIEEETGGHVFTINFSNANSISQINSLSATQQSWGKGQFRLGFTISRMFDLKPKKKEPTKY